MTLWLGASSIRGCGANAPSPLPFMADDRFYSAFLSLDSHRVCGYRLRPFSLKARVTLEAIASPILPGSKDASKATPADLILAARVCAIADPFEAVKGGRFRDKVWLLRMLGNAGQFATQLVAWRHYLTDTARHPLVVSTKEQKNHIPSGVEWPLAVATALVGMGFTEEEAWTMPEGRAMFYFYANAIKEGADLRIVTTEFEAELPAKRRAVEEAIAKAKAAAVMTKR